MNKYHFVIKDGLVIITNIKNGNWQSVELIV